MAAFFGENSIKFPLFPFVVHQQQQLVHSALVECFVNRNRESSLSERAVARRESSALVTLKLWARGSWQRVHATNSQLLVALAYLTVPPTTAQPLSFRSLHSLLAAHKQCEIFIAYFAAAATYTHTRPRSRSDIYHFVTCNTRIGHSINQIKSCIKRGP